MFRDIGAYNMNYSEFKKMCRKAWCEKFNYLYIDLTRDKEEVIYRLLNESKNTYIECKPESETF